jgi:MFS family permease
MNGGKAIFNSVVAEITDTTNIARAYGILPLSWTGGGTIGPLIGGSLAHPVENYPALFGSSDLLKYHPYLLASSVPAIYAILMMLLIHKHFEEVRKNTLH